MTIAVLQEVFGSGTQQDDVWSPRRRLSVGLAEKVDWVTAYDSAMVLVSLAMLPVCKPTPRRGGWFRLSELLSVPQKGQEEGGP